MQEKKESMSSRGSKPSGMEESRMGQGSWSGEEKMRSIKGQIQALDQDMTKATSQAAKDDIKQRRDELQRQLDSMQKM